MSSLNKVFILGRVGQEPEIRRTSDGSPVANLSVATSSVSTKGGDRKEYTEWHKVVIFNKAAEVAQNYVKKGTQVLIEGSLTTRKWQDKEGNDRYTTEIVCGRLTLLGKGSDQKPEASQTDADDYARASGGTAKTFDDIEDDPIPF
jgi:single-strand DNA-binding protein